jgi:ferrous iron transport protein A
MSRAQRSAHIDLDKDAVWRSITASNAASFSLRRTAQLDRGDVPLPRTGWHRPMLLFRLVIDNQSHHRYVGGVMVPVSLETLPPRQQATVAAIEWERLAPPEARRLREFGFDEGVGVEVLHRARLGRGPIACRIGRMTVALRRAVAGAIHVAPLAR